MENEEYYQGILAKHEKIIKELDDKKYKKKYYIWTVVGTILVLIPVIHYIGIIIKFVLEKRVLKYTRKLSYSRGYIDGFKKTPIMPD